MPISNLVNLAKMTQNLASRLEDRSDKDSEAEYQLDKLIDSCDEIVELLADKVTDIVSSYASDEDGGRQSDNLHCLTDKNVTEVIETLCEQWNVKLRALPLLSGKLQECAIAYHDESTDKMEIIVTIGYRGRLTDRSGANILFYREDSKELLKDRLELYIGSYLQVLDVIKS